MLTEKELDILRRRARGERQERIAKSLGISQAAVSQFETNAHRKILEAQRVQELAKRLGLRTEEGLAGPTITYGGGKR